MKPSMIWIAMFFCSVVSGCSILAPKKEETFYVLEYPEIPDDYPFPVIWRRPAGETAWIPRDKLKGFHLLHLVMVKLWNEGDHDFVGAMQEDGKIYPLYRDVAYVTWDEVERPDGTLYRYASNILTGNPRAVRIDRDNPPEGIKLIELDSAGIDPFEFLGIGDGDVLDEPAEQ